MLIARFLILVEVATRIGLHVLVLRKHFHTVQCCSIVIPLCLRLCFSSCLYKAFLSVIDQLTQFDQASLSTTVQLCEIKSCMPN